MALALNAAVFPQIFNIQTSTVFLTPMFVLFPFPKQKAACAVQVKDAFLEYEFEGQGSSAGSVGCCSLLGSDNDLQFLNDLGSKFKTLAEICSPPIAIPKPFLTHTIASAVKTHTVDIAEPVVRAVETKHTAMGVLKTEQVMSSTNISKLSDSTVSTARASMTHAHSNVTNISHSSHINHSATLPRQGQTVILQQQPVYYTTAPVLQPMHYVVQPQLQNTVMLADGAHGANFPGLYVVSGPQSPSSGLVFSGSQGSHSGLFIQGMESPTSPVSFTSQVSPTMLLPGGPGVSQGSVHVEGWKMVGPNSDGNYMLVKDNVSPGEAMGSNPGTSQGTLSRDAILVKEAAPPQGAFGPAAQGRVYGILPGHTLAKKGDIVAVNSNLGQTWVREPGTMGLGPVFGVGVGQPRMRMGHVVTAKPEVTKAGIWPTGMNPVGMGQVNMIQFQGNPPLEQTVDASGIVRASRASPKKHKTTNTVKTAKTHKPSKKEIMITNPFQDDSNPGLNMHIDAVKEKQEVVTYTSEHDEEPCKATQSTFEDNESIKEYPTPTSEKYSTVNLEGITEAPANKFTDEISRKIESNDTEEESELLEKYVTSEGFSNEGISMIIEMSSTEALQSGSDVTDLVNIVKENEEISTFPRGEAATSISDPITIVDDQIQDSTEVNVDRQEATTLKEGVEETGKFVQLSIEGSEDRIGEVGSEPQSSEATEELMDKNLEEDVSQTENTERNQVMANSDSIQAEENMEEMTAVTSVSHEEVMVEQEQVLEPEVRLDTVADKLPAASPNYNSTANANSEARISMQTLSTISTNQEDPGDSNVILASAEMSPPVQAEGVQHITSESGVDSDQVDVDSPSDGEKKESILEDGVSQQSFSTPDDQDEDIKRQCALSSQMEDNFNSNKYITEDEHALEEMASPLQLNISFSEEQDEGSTEEDSCSRSEVEGPLISDDTINVPEEEDKKTVEELTSSIHQSVSITDYQDKDIEGEAVSGRTHLEDQITTGSNIEEKEEHIMEEIASAKQSHFRSSNDKDEEIGEVDAGNDIHQVDNLLISDNSIQENKEEDIVEEESPVHQTDFTPEENEVSRIENSSTICQAHDKVTSDDSVSDGEKETPSIEHNILISGEPGTSSHVEEEEDIQSNRLLDEDSQPLETECLFEGDLHLASKHAGINLVAAVAEDVKTQETPGEVTSHQLRQGIASPQTGDISLDIPEREHTDGQALVMGANMEGLCLVRSSEEMRSSRVATGQVSMLSQDKGTSCGTLASERVAEDETSQSNYHNPDVSLIEPSELGNLSLEKGKEEVTFDPEITQGLDNSATNASGQVSPTVYSEIKAADKTIPSVLEKDPGLSETGAACFIEEAGDLVQNESVHMTGDAAWVSLNTVKSADLTEGVSKAPDHTHDAEASGGEMSPVQLQSVISQAPRNKSRKSQKDSNKNPNSPSGKCKQQ